MNTLGTYTVTYNTTDSNGITGTRTRTVIVDDGPIITLNGSNPYYITTGSSVYLELGATSDGGETITIDSSAVNLNIAGSYSVTYDVTDINGLQTTETRNVIVRGGGPVITLVGSDPYTVSLGFTYTDPGATSSGGETVSIDTNDLNIYSLGTYTIIYSATDSNGTTTTTTRTVNTAGPAITVTGDNPYYVTRNTTYTDPGATSNGGETVSIDTSQLDMNVADEYTVTYSATDSNGATGYVNRTVIVLRELTSLALFGQDIDGEATFDRSGWSVSLSSDGTRVAIGATQNGGNGTESGHTRIWEWNSGTRTWTQMGQDIDGEASYDQSGYSVSLSSNGTRVAIGTPYNDGNGGSSGHTRIWEWNSGTSTWTQMGQDIDGEASNDNSGYSVSLSSDGTRVAIGAIYNDGYNTNSGHTRIWEWNSGTSTWTQMGQDIDGDEGVDVRSGFSVSLSGDGTRVAIGAPRNDGNGTDSGHTRIWEWNSGTSTWTQVGQDIDGEVASDHSGTSVSLSSDGTRVAIGAPYNDANGTSSGHTRIWEWNSGTSTWTQMGQDIDGEATYDESGYSVSLSSDGTRVAIGARLNDANGSNSGHTRIWDWNGSNWIQLGQDIDGEASGDNSGYSVSLSSSGNRVAIGAPWNYGVNGNYSGHVRVYDLYPRANLSINGDNPQYVELLSTYNDPGINTDSNYDIVTSNTEALDMTSRGTYTVYYSSYDPYVQEYTYLDSPRIVVVDAPVITLSGFNPYYIGQNGVYIDPGATSDGGETVTIGSSNLNTSVQGTYQVYYSATDSRNFSNTVTRTVIVDSRSIINLTGDNPYYIQRGSTYTDPGATSSGGESVTVDSSAVNTNVRGQYRVSYSATDVNNLNILGYRNVIVDSPIITLIGNETILLPIGISYTELGAVSDGGETVIIDSSALDINTLGTYLVTYSATDSRGFTETINRNIRVIIPEWFVFGQVFRSGTTYTNDYGCSVSVSFDGTRIAIGDRSRSSSGSVSIYEWNSGTSTWTQMGQHIYGEASYDNSGYSVSLSSDGTRVAIGASYNDGNGTDSGHTRIWEWNSVTSTWTQMGQDIDGEASYDRSGWSVSLSSDGTRVAIGAPYNDANGTDSGHTRVYEWNSGTSTWTQMGQDIDGEAVPDRSGWSVSLSSDGTRVAIGAIYNDGNGADSGHTRIWEWNSVTSTWTQMGQDIDGEVSYDNSGHSVSLSSDGTRVAIGAKYNDGNGGNVGHARIWEWNSGTSTWTQMGQDIDGEASSDQSGYSVSLSSDGTRVAIGARLNDANGTDSGHVRVYEWNSGTSTWVKLGSDLDGETTIDYFGTVVTLSGDGNTVIGTSTASTGAYVIVFKFAEEPSAYPTLLGNNPYYIGRATNYLEPGASYSSGTMSIVSYVDTNVRSTYKVYYYLTSSDGTTSTTIRTVIVDSPIITPNGDNPHYHKIGTTYTDAGATSDGGETVTIASNDLDVNTIGSYNIVYGATDSNGFYDTETRNIQVFSNIWSQVGATIYGEAAYDRSGYSVSLSSDGTRMAIGAPQNYYNTGHTRVYEWNSGTSTWTQMGQDIDGEAARDQSGYSVSLSSDGTRVAIGASYNDGNGADSGHTRIWEWNSGTSTWTQMGQDIDGEASYDQSGYSVSLSSNGTRVAIGAFLNDVNGSNSGHTRIWEWNGSTWTQMGQDIDGRVASSFSGRSVSLSSNGTRVVIGAYYDPIAYTRGGLVRVYEWSGSAWNQLGQDMTGLSSYDYAGYSVAICGDGTRIAYFDRSPHDMVKVFEWNSGTSTWTQLGSGITSSYTSLSYIGGYSAGRGISMSNDGSRILLGATNETIQGQVVTGRAYVYEFDGTAWNQLGQVMSGDHRVQQERFGWSVGMSSNGNRIAVGAIQSRGAYNGYVKVYDYI
jgi:hypothetical protein